MSNSRSRFGGASSSRHSGARAPGSALRAVRAQAPPASPESIPTACGYGFRPSPLSRLGRNDELKGLSPSNTSSFPRRVFCARVLFFASLTRNEGWAEHRETYGRSCEAPVRRVRTRQALVRRLASLVRGTLASRRSTVAILGSGPALPSPDLRPDRSQRAPRIRVLVPGGRGPRASRGERLPAARRGTPLLAPSSRRCSRRHPSGTRM